MIAILSDIHANLEALEAVLVDADRWPVQAIYCLGDLIGYGPDPIPCVQYAMTWPVVIQGDFEHNSLHGGDGLFPTAPHPRQTILRFRRELSLHPAGTKIKNYLLALSTQFETANALHVHGSPRNHLNEYLFPEDVDHDRKMEVMASRFDSLCFCGHTHMPGVFHRGSRGWNFTSPKECNYKYSIKSDQVICNVGSVGQPRDNDPRACYVLFDSDTIIFRRVEYDLERTIQKLPEDSYNGFFGRRLREGR